MTRRKLVFFTTADPAKDPATVTRVYHFAGVAGTNGLEAEVRLAGAAVSVVDFDRLPDTEEGRELAARVAEGVDGPFLVSL